MDINWECCLLLPDDYPASLEINILVCVYILGLVVFVVSLLVHIYIFYDFKGTIML